MTEYQKLMDKAEAARENAYAPYSGFRVGAALLTKNGAVYSGCNIENAAYSPTNCAERTAVFKAVSDGEREFAAIAVAGNPGHEDFIFPCGVCLQVLLEFCEKDKFTVIVKNGAGELACFLLKDLAPRGFLL